MCLIIDKQVIFSYQIVLFVILCNPLNGLNKDLIICRISNCIKFPVAISTIKFAQDQSTFPSVARICNDIISRMDTIYTGWRSFIHSDLCKRDLSKVKILTLIQIDIKEE